MRALSKRSRTRSAPVPALLAVLALTLAGCGGGGGGAVQPSSADGGSASTSGGGVTGGTVEAPAAGAASAANRGLDQVAIAGHVFDPRVTEFAVHAFYEDGAEPYTGSLGLSPNDVWDITAESYRELFAAHPDRVVSVPSRLDRMGRFDDQGVQRWDIGALVALGESMVPRFAEEGRANVSIVFVNGLYEGNPNVLGIHPGGNPFAFVFKDVVESVGGDPMTQRYAEQATVVHELGHVVGFVDNGVPMANPHEDAEHPHHTTNDDGVMYWAVESRSGALEFLTGVIGGARLQLFGPETLLDGQNHQPTD